MPAFPPALTDALIAEARLPGILGNKHASGVPIIEELGEEHIRTGKPICYTSADSVFQIAAHETHFGLERLYEVCEIARRLCDPLNIGRVIARPFVGETPETFKRTANRRDYAVPPPEPTLLDRLTEAGPHGDLGRQDRRHLRPSRHRHDPQGAERHGAVRPHAGSGVDRPATATWSSPTTSISTRSTATAATSPAMRRRWRPSTRACRNSCR